MRKTLITPRTGVLASMILLAGVWRFIIPIACTPLQNFTPIGAMALFGGCYFADKWKAYLFPLLALWISDLFLGYFVYHHKLVWFYDGFLWTYGSFAMIVVIGSFMKNVKIKNVILTAVGAALLHWVITDLGVWLDGRIYPMNWEGLVACYVAALPYLANMLIANLVFGAVMFGAFEMAQRKFAVLSLNNNTRQ